MNGLLKLAGWQKSEDDLNRDLAALKSKLDSHDANKPVSADPSEHSSWRNMRRAIEDDIASHEDSIRIAREQKALAQAEADQAEADRRHAAAQKLARAGEKLTLDVVAAGEKLAAALAALEANRAEVEAANAVRGSRPYIADGERRLRETPAREIPSVARREKAWLDSNGNRPSQLVERNGELVPAGMSGDFTLREVEVVESAARIEPARMPERLADAIRLVGFKGERLWPR